MITIKIPEQPQIQLWDEVNEMFVYKPAEKGCELVLEHSLLSIAKWESIWCKPFLTEDEKTVEETLSYIRCMVVTPSKFDPEIVNRIPRDEYDKVQKYIDSPATATFINGSNNGKKGRGKVITSEQIYYWMSAANINWACEKWHLNRLLMLLKICEIENDSKSQEKLSKNEIRKNNDKLNELRRKAMHSKG